MPSDYNKIREENIREYGEGERHLSFLGKLYTERTHFIFELLQNAEDAGASRILFELFKDRLEVRHDGRLFSESDVRGICGIGEGRKAGDLTQIGKFGIGFKSVYAYTSTPEIHSGDEHFRIENFVRPYDEKNLEPGPSWTTFFLMPFKTDIAGNPYEEIAERLCNLSARTLLFLHKIKEIEYRLEDKRYGTYLYEEKNRRHCRQITVIGERNEKQVEDEDWLIFKQDVKMPPQDKHFEGNVQVEIAFRLNSKDQGEEIVRIEDSPLVVSFQTEKTTRLGFLIQGPYKTTPARDNVPGNDDWNKKLIQETSALLTETVLPELKKMRLLTVSLLEAMPIRMDDFPEDGMFFPIAEAVRNALLNQALLPTVDNETFVVAKNAKLARAAALRELFSRGQLRLLFQTKDKIEWLTGTITRDRTTDLHRYLLEKLGVDEITSEKAVSNLWKPFLQKQSDEWMIKLYKYVNKRKELWDNFRSRPVVRLQDDSHVEPQISDDGSPGAYLADGNHSETSLPVVKENLTLSDEEVYRFLKELGIPELDVVEEVIEKILPKYAKNSQSVSSEEHYSDIGKIQKAYESANGEKKRRLGKNLKSTPFILSKNLCSGKSFHKKPQELYFEDDELRLYFSGNGDLGFVDSNYPESAMKLFEDLGVARSVRVQRKESDSKNFIVIKNQHGNHKRCLDNFDPDIHVEGLEKALASPTPEKSKFIWNNIAIPHSDCIQGEVEQSSRQTYESSIKKKEISKRFGSLLINTSWLPSLDGGFKKPSKLSLEDLPDTFKRNERLSRQLEMKLDVVAKLAKEAGISTERIDLIKILPESLFKKLQRDLSTQDPPPEFPEGTPPDPERAKEKTAEQIQSSLDKKYEPRQRNVRTSRGTVDPSTLLRNWYTNDKGKMVCQICREEMPFRKRDGEYYFEAVEALSNDHFTKEYEVQFLALCPLCAAKYKEFVKKDERATLKLKNELMSSDNREIALSLGEDRASIRFVPTHYLSIKTAIDSIHSK